MFPGKKTSFVLHNREIKIKFFSSSGFLLISSFFINLKEWNVDAFKWIYFHMISYNKWFWDNYPRGKLPPTLKRAVKNKNVVNRRPHHEYLRNQTWKKGRKTSYQWQLGKEVIWSLFVKFPIYLELFEKTGLNVP